MKRLTTKIKDNMYACGFDREDLINKLGQLEDIEEKYGIDLIAVFNNFEKDGLIWCGSKGKIIQIVDTDKRVYYEDKELTKEELEK